MTRTAEAIKHLEAIHDRLNRAVATVARKRWRDSEKIMTVAQYRQEIAAIEYAIERLQNLDELCKLIAKTTIDEVKPWIKDADR